MRRGLYALVALGLAIAAIQTAGTSAAIETFSRALLACLSVGVAVVLAWLAPSLLRGLRRVRSEAFRAGVSRVTQLPRWYVVPASVVGCAAEDATERAQRFVLAEARCGAAWLAAGMTAIVALAIDAAAWSTWSVVGGLLAAVVVAALVRWHSRLAT